MNFEQQPSGWVTLPEFCKVANITYPTALRWCKLDMINFVQYGGQKRIYAEEIKRFLQFGTLPPNQERLSREREIRHQKRRKVQTP
jgi:hypothetical protein